MPFSMTASPVTVEVQDTHLYPGALGRAFDFCIVQRAPASRPCIVVFADRTVVHGVINAGNGEDFVLDVPAYVTARGTRIPAKSWLVALTLSGGAVAMRVRKRL